LQAKVIDSPT